MKREDISQYQAVSIVALFTVGSSLLLGVSNTARQDSWMGFLVAAVAVVPVIYIFTRILGRYPGMNLFDICEQVFGKVAGKVVVVMYSWYALHLGALVFRNYSEFIQVRVFDHMPQTVSLLLMAILVITVVRRGIENLGRWAAVTLPIVMFLIMIVTVLLVKDMHLVNLLPVGEYMAEVPKTAFGIFSFPLAETVLMMGILNTLKPGGKPGRAWLWGLLLGGGALLISILRNLMVLGFPMENDRWFPGYDAASLIIAGSFISRIENIVGANMLLGVFVKVSACLMVASKGAAKLFNAEDYRPYAAPLGLVMVALASIVYSNTMEMFDFVDVYPYYAFVFEVILPVLLCVVAEIRHLVKSKKEKGGAPSPAPAGGK